MKSHKQKSSELRSIKFHKDRQIDILINEEETLQKRGNQAQRATNLAVSLQFFGRNLFDCGFDLNDFLADVIILVALGAKEGDNLYTKVADKYSGVKNFPSFDVLIKLSSNKIFLGAIEDGYNYAKRRAQFAQQKRR